MNSLKNNIIEKINKGEVAMKPRWYFMLQTIFLFLAIGIVALVAVYIMSFIVYFLQQSGLIHTSGFGLKGYMFFVMASPWLLISLLLLFVGFLFVLVKQYAFSYRKPLVYSLIIIVLSVIACSMIVQYATIHERLERYMERHKIPGLAPLYRDMPSKRPVGMVVGTVVLVEENSIKLMVANTERDLMVIVTPETKGIPHTLYKEGEMVMVFGRLEGDKLYAYGIKPAHDMPLSSKERSYRAKYEQPPSLTAPQ